MIITLDIETVPDQREDAYRQAWNRIKAPANWKDPEKIKNYIEEKAQEAYRDTALNGLYGQICAIGYKIEDEPAECIYDGAEADILHVFDRVMQGLRSKPYFVGHKLRDFDLKFMRQRYWINGLRWWFGDPRHPHECFDTLWAWSGYERKGKLSEIAKAMGIEYPDADGSQVWDWYQAGDWDSIRTYNIAQVEATYQIYRRMM